MQYKKSEIFMLWDESDGINYSKCYQELESAKIALYEHYTDYWINNNKAKILTIDCVSYKLSGIK